MNKSKFFKRAALSLAVSSMLVSMQVSAADPVISNIQIRGLNRVSKGAVLLALPVKEGDVMINGGISSDLSLTFKVAETVGPNGEIIGFDPNVKIIDKINKCFTFLFRFAKGLYSIGFLITHKLTCMLT